MKIKKTQLGLILLFIYSLPVFADTRNVDAEHRLAVISIAFKVQFLFKDSSRSMITSENSPIYWNWIAREHGALAPDASDTVVVKRLLALTATSLIVPEAAKLVKESNLKPVDGLSAKEMTGQISEQLTILAERYPEIKEMKSKNTTEVQTGSKESAKK